MKEHEMAFLSLIALGTFSVDNQGRVWRHKWMAGSRTGSPTIQKVLKDPIRADRAESHGYPKIMFTLNGKRYAVYVHRVVWMIANQDDIPDMMEINHKDGNPQNPHPSNLELVYRSENVRHAVETLQSLPKWKDKIPVKLTDQQAIEIYQMCKEKVLTQANIAKKYGVSIRMVQAIYYGQKWKHIPRD
jgi:DNA-binding transcriptional regulator YiaG